MSEPLPATLSEVLRAVVGRYARATIRNPAACARCAGAKSGHFTLCYKCSRYPTAAFPDCAGFGTYARPDDTAGRAMHTYKGAPPSQDGQRLMRLMLAHGLAHRGCAEQFVGEPITHFALVPSTRGRATPMARFIPAPMLAELVEVGIQHRAGVTPRRIDPDMFQADTMSGTPHVLVLDDTWVSGGNLLSAVNAVRASGAGKVTTFCVARWVASAGQEAPTASPNMVPLGAYLAGAFEFDPSVCPYAVPCVAQPR